MAQSKVMQKPSRRKRKGGVDWRNLPQDALATMVIVAVETISAAGIFQIVKGHAEVFTFQIDKAPVLAVASLGCALLSFVCNRKAEELKSDTRPEHQARAKNARKFGTAILFVPIFFLATSFAFDQQHTRWEELKGSPAQTAAEVAAAPDEYGHVDAQAVLDLQAFAEPKQVRFDLTFLAALIAATFLHLVPMRAASAAWAPKPETPAQAKQRERMDRSAKSAATKAANKLAKDAQDEAERKTGKRPGWLSGIFNGRKAA